MKWIFLILASCSFHCSGFAAYLSQEENDAIILECVQSEAFLNKVVYYRGSEHYPIRIMHNPKGELLFGNDHFFREPTSLNLAVIGNLLPQDANYVKDLILNQSDREYDDYDIDLRCDRMFVPIFGQLHPAMIGNTIDAFDEEVSQVFRSVGYDTQVFYYYLGDKYFKVRIIHNPQNLNYIASIPYTMDGRGEILTIKHNHTYEIIVDEKAPKELIKHLCLLTNASWWDWYYNFIIYNGTDVTHTRSTYHFDYSWNLGRVFYSTEGLRLATF